MNIQMNFKKKAALFIWLQFLFIFNINCDCIFENRIYQVSDFAFIIFSEVYHVIEIEELLTTAFLITVRNEKFTIILV